jgi:F-type H+-transporting ATPase subunit gamma
MRISQVPDNFDDFFRIRNAGEIQQLSVAYNRFENTMTQVPTITQLVPMVADKVEDMSHHWDYLYEPNAQEALNALLVRYIEALV